MFLEAGGEIKQRDEWDSFQFVVHHPSRSAVGLRFVDRVCRYDFMASSHKDPQQKLFCLHNKHKTKRFIPRYVANTIKYTEWGWGILSRDNKIST